MKYRKNKKKISVDEEKNTIQIINPITGRKETSSFLELKNRFSSKYVKSFLCRYGL